jgi:YidC/Oxa1 family membrane protein insertase
MQALQRLQPQMKELQAKYKDDKQRQQQEMMKFYKENNVNPLGSCLPLLAQLPVMISLFYMLRQSLRADICPSRQPGYSEALHKVVSLAKTVPCGVGHGAGFLFIGDLTNKATGAVLIVLLVLYVGTQLVSSLLMQSPTMDKTQRQIMLFMPLIFVFIVINFPAGVIVYWITTNTWTIVQQYIVKRRIGPIGAPVVAADGPKIDSSGGTAGGSGSGPRRPSSRDKSDDDKDSGGGLGGLLRGRAKAAEEKEPAGVGARGRASVPPPPPRKKKKRSGRRR